LRSTRQLRLRYWTAFYTACANLPTLPDFGQRSPVGAVLTLPTPPSLGGAPGASAYPTARAPRPAPLAELRAALRRRGAGTARGTAPPRLPRPGSTGP